jgi:protocatechuate 4,5-dioxygenase beta chain
LAQVVIGLGVSHNPFHYRLTRAPRAQWSPDAEQMEQRLEQFREKLRRAEPDTLLVVANDHFHQFFMDNMPAFLIGKMDVFDAIYYNETREFGLPRGTVPGDVDLADRLLLHGIAAGVDFAFSHELKIDHAVMAPLMFLRPDLDLPIVPLLTNCAAPPLPTAARFYQVGRLLRQIIQDLPDKRRVGVIASGNLSLEVGGPLQFSPHAFDEAFDSQAVDWIARGDAESAIHACTFEYLTAAGNVTHAYLNYILGMGLMDGARVTHAEALKRAGPSQPFFAWEPEEEARA